MSNIVNSIVWIPKSLSMPSNFAMPYNIDHTNQVEVVNEDIVDNLCTNAMGHVKLLTKAMCKMRFWDNN
jgi:hypothetical protein